MNYTSTINIPSSHIPYEKEGKGCDTEHFNIHYQKNVKPVFNLIRQRVNEISNLQDYTKCNMTVNILWNKCRYFEMTCTDAKIRRFVAQSAKVKVKYNNMLIGDRTKLEAVVRAFNKQGVYCRITQEWI